MPSVVPTAIPPSATALASLHLLAGEARPSLADLPVVLLTDAENVEVGETNDECGGSVQQAHHEAREEGRGWPGMGAPLKDVPMVAWFAPPKEGGKEHQAGVDPDEGDATAQSARRHQLVVGQGFGDGQVAVHTDASQAGHGDTLENGDDVAEDLAGDGLLDACRVVQQRQGGDQTAEAHQQVSIGHSLDEIAGGVMVQQRSTVEHEDDGQVSGNDKDSQQHNNGRL